MKDYNLLNIDNAIILGAILLEPLAMSIYKKTKNVWLFVILYGIIGFGMTKIISIKGMGMGNALFDLIGIVIVSIIGFAVFGEKLTKRNIIGLILGMISIYLLN